MSQTFNVRHFEGKDFKMYESWLHARNRDCPEVEQLPKYGLISSKLNNPISAGFIANQGGGVCCLCFFASNPLEDNVVRSMSLDLLIDELIEMAKALRFKRAYLTTNKAALIRRVEKRDFKEYDTGLTQLWRDL